MRARWMAPRAGGSSLTWSASRSSRPSPFAPAAGYGGRFYPARGAYLWWNDCNRWTVERLAAAGLARGGRGVIFSGQVARHLVGFRRVR